MLSGPTDVSSQQASSVNIVTSHTLKIDAQVELTDRLDATLKKFWELESLGINSDESSVLENFDDEVSFQNGRYQVSLPWKQPHPILPDNYHLSKKRLHGLLRRLRQHPSVLKEYDATIRDQLNKGIVERVSMPEHRSTCEVHYMPHHAVIRQDKQTTKLRVVYDASAKSDGPSLNDCLFTGPKFGQNIMDIILRFRTHKVALVADIEKAFLMVSMCEKDRDVLRFIWVDDITKDEPELIHLRFTRVVFGVSSSPFLLNATIGHHLSKYSTVLTGTVKKISRSIYVDDVAYGAETEDLAYDLYTESKSMLKEGGFNLRKFVTNSSVLQKRLDDQECMLQPPSIDPLGSTEDESYTKSTLGITQPANAGETKVLGVRWDPVLDCLVFDFREVATQAANLEPIKRHIVGVATRFYDPVGFVSPVTIRFKMLFQELCEAKLDWDEPLPPYLLRKWQDLVSSLNQAQPMCIPRYYFEDTFPTDSVIRLHGFCDASKKAYAAVVYLSVETSSCCVRKFVACKTRVAPLKEQTIPRLELLSALLLTKLMASVSSALEPELTLGEPSYFTDSKVSLYWIKGQAKEWKPFVQNRVDQIRSSTLIDQWQHCPGAENPADIPSRGIDPHQLQSCPLWLSGPNLLPEGDTSSDHDDPTTMPDECKLEQRKSKKTHTLLTPANGGTEPKIGKSIKCEDFGSKGQLLRVTCYVLKFIKLLRQRASGIQTGTLTTTMAPCMDLQEAENYWLKDMQATLETRPKFKIWQQQFGLFRDDSGIWRCGGRLANAQIPFSTKHPILLDSQHHLTTLIVQDAHARLMHNGVRETLTELRSRYWIVRGRSFVRKILHQCVLCRRFEGRAFHPPPPPPLPSFRVNQAPAFAYTGVDYAGPLYIRETRELENTKVWICLYTCCVVRAIHLEVVPDMTAQSFIRSFKRFTSRRGFPVKVVSDNAKTFKSASKVLARIVKHPALEQYLTDHCIQWSFNLEKAPWWGGIFERMVRSVKRCLRKTIGRGRLTLDELTTAVTEVEMIVNSRPLTYFSTEDVEEPVTPSHLIAGRRLMSLPDGPYHTDMDDIVGTSHSDLTKRLIHLNNVLEHFWKRWRKEYLLELRDSHRHVKLRPNGSTISIGSVVLVHDADRPRGFWKIAKVEDVLTGADGQVRGATVRIHSSGNRSILLRRPVQLLYPLEVFCHEVDDSSSDNSNLLDTEQACRSADTPEPTHQRPRRMAARNAREAIRIQAEEF